MRILLASAISGLAGLGLPAATAQSEGFYSAPAMDSEKLIFSSEGDLWRAPVTGGVAMRLTTHPEVETAPKLSPDGQWIAFNGSYDGPQEVYIMPANGGAPVRLTHEGGGVEVRGWLDANTILYNTSNLPGVRAGLLRTVDRQSGATQDIPLNQADEATLSEDGSTLVFTRYGLSSSGDNAVHYRGGSMAQLWSYAMGSNGEATQLASDFAAPIRHPMWWQGRIYFISDKSGADNIWSVDATGGDARQHTSSERWLMKSPYLYDGKIFYQSGADLYTYDIASDATSELSISLMSDADYKRVRWISDPLDYLNFAGIAPDGESVSITARGRFVTAFTKDRRRVEYRIPADYRARSAVMGSEGKWLYALVDGGTTGEIWRFAADGTGEGEPLTSGSDTYIWELIPSPHDETLLYTDKKGRLFAFDPETKTRQLIDETAGSSDYAFGDFNWSSGGRYLAYTFYDGRDIAQLAVYDTKTKKKTVLTDGKYESFSPAFSRDGEWLYFISNRHFDADPSSPWGDRNMGPSFRSRGMLFALQLAPEAAFPFAHADELTSTNEDEDKAEEADDVEDEDKDEKDEEDEKDASEADIEFVAAAARLYELPVGNGAYAALGATDENLLVQVGGGSDLVYTGDRDASLKKLEFSPDKPELADFTGDINAFQLSADAKTVLVVKGDGASTRFYLVNPDKPYPSDTSTQEARVSDWKLRLSAQDEWVQMASDAWRMHRDFAFDPNLRSVDWTAVGEYYLPMAKRLGHRTELNDLMGQMTSELGILHSQLRQGEVPFDAEKETPAFLGATYEAVPNGLRIASIYEGETDRPNTLGPLLKPGVDVKVGDVLKSVDGVAVTSQADLAEQLVMKAGQQVLLGLERDKKTFREIVEPVSRGGVMGLRYTDWVQRNGESVEAASGGKIGYLHLRAMGGSDVESFARDFYGQFDKDGLIIDVRGNRGGNIDSWIIGALLRKAWAFWKSPHGGPAYTNMQQAFRGHLVVLIDEGTYSDGETFAAGIKALDLAPLIGTRTAGAGIWLSDRNRLVDGGQARVAEYGQYGLDGRWLLEGRGVAPDIEIDTPPHAAYEGRDLQLDRAVSYLEDKIVSDPIPVLTPESIPPVGTSGRDVK